MVGVDVTPWSFVPFLFVLSFSPLSVFFSIASPRLSFHLLPIFLFVLFSFLSICLTFSLIDLLSSPCAGPAPGFVHTSETGQCATPGARCLNQRKNPCTVHRMVIWHVHVYGLFSGWSFSNNNGIQVMHHEHGNAYNYSIVSLVSCSSLRSLTLDVSRAGRSQGERWGGR